MSRLDQIRDRLQHATWGLWKTVAIPEAESELATQTGEPVPHVDLYTERHPIHVERNEPGVFVGRVDCAEKPDAENVACIVGASEADVALLRDAPSDLRYLLACVEALRAALNHTTRALGQCSMVLGEGSPEYLAARDACHAALSALKKCEAP